MRMMFLDESGNHNLKKINPHYPVFVLGGVIVDRAYARTVIEPQMKEFKLRVFGQDEIVLHTTICIGCKTALRAWLILPFVLTSTEP